MRAGMGWLTSLLLCVATAAGAQAPTGPEPRLSGAALVAALREGGFNLYFRHAQTDWNQPDQIAEAGDWLSCDPQRVRQLSAQGRETARAVGEAIRALRIPLGAVYASPYCRTVQTARAMALGEVQATDDVINLRVADYVGGRQAVLDRARARLASAPPAGRNNVYVAHGNVALHATTVYPEEAEGLVFRPLGGGQFEFVGRLAPRQWRALAGLPPR